MYLRILKFAAITLTMAMLLPFGANATLILEIPGSEIFQQTENSPCVIGDNSCNNPVGFPYTLISAGGGVSEYTRESHVYTVGQLVGAVGSDYLAIGIDLNQAGDNNQTLGFFETYINSGLVPALSYVGPTELTLANNGNGYSDSILTGLDLSTSSLAALIQFRVNIVNNSAGDEQFFLIASEGGGGGGQAIVPEPGTVSLIGIGLGLLVVARLRRLASRSF